MGVTLAILTKSRIFAPATAIRQSNCARRQRGTIASSPSKRDSHLEAFSHNPLDGSIALLVAKHVNQMPETAVPFVQSRITVTITFHQ